MHTHAATAAAAAAATGAERFGLDIPAQGIRWQLDQGSERGTLIIFNTQAKEGIPLILSCSFIHVFIRVTYLIDTIGVGRVFLSERRSIRGSMVQQRAARQGLSVLCKRRHLHWSMVRGSTMRLRYPHIRCVRCTLSTCCIPQLTHVDCGDDDQ